MATTITIYTPAGSIIKRIEEPESWSLDSKNPQILWVTRKSDEPEAKSEVVTTSLPFIIERWVD
ncbi:MAG: hypothetical protein ABSG60_13190 [Terracidiphilus sp.]|jgi:hypothetical protein